MKLIPNWKRVARKSYTTWSILAAQLGLAAIAFWPQIPEDFKPYINVQYLVWGISIVLGLGFIGRLILQVSLSIDEAEHQPPGE